MFKDKKSAKKDDEHKLTKAELKKREADLMRKEQAKRMGIDLEEVKKEKKEMEKEVSVIKKDLEEREANGEDVSLDDRIENLKLGILPNLNHVMRDQALEDEGKYADVVDVSGIDNVLDAMAGGKVVAHPEKKVKAAWEEFLEKRLPEMKSEFPGFKRTKHIDMLRKEWDKCLDNPFNQNTIAYNQK